MRIIAGKHRSRKLLTLEGQTTRPTLDQVKESFFSFAGGYFYDCTVLDGFAGSGAIGLEFLSRGASHVIFVEKDRQAARIVQQNIHLLSEDNQSELKIMPLERAIDTFNQSFDIIYLDPPYHYDNIVNLFEKLKKVCKDTTKIFYECDLNDIMVSFDGFECMIEKTYRRTKILQFRRKI